MSEKFSVEDILKEVKLMTSETYVSHQDTNSLKKQVSNTEDNFKPRSEALKSEHVSEEKKSEPTHSRDSFLPEDIDVIDDAPHNKFDISNMSPDEFFKIIEENSEKNSEPEIVGGFKVKSSLMQDSFKGQELEHNEKEDTVSTTSSNDTETIVFDKLSFDSSEKKPAQQADSEKKTDIIEERFKPGREHMPNHLLKPEEIISNSINESPSFRFNDRVKDLTSRKKDSTDGQTHLNKNVLTEEEVKSNLHNEKIDLTDFINKNFSEQRKTFEQPDKVDGAVKEIAENEDNTTPDFIKHENENTENKSSFEYSNTSKEENNSYIGKHSRRINEKSFDFSENTVNYDDVIDDYSNIEDEEPVKFDLELSIKKINKRLWLTIAIFILGSFITILPQFDINIIDAVSQKQNFTGFMFANIAILGTVLIVNIMSFFRGLGNLITLKPDIDSAVSVASLFVIAQNVISFIPQNSAAASKLPFFTISLVFVYILTLLGKKSLVTRIRNNFRLVATTTVKRECFVADEHMGEYLENDDFIGTPSVACSRDVINLQNYLKNSYCQDPSDNVSRVFSAVGLVVSLAVLALTYFTTKDIVTSIFYATAVSLLSTPASSALAVCSPMKKASEILGQREGLISGYDSVNEFADVDCIAVDAEELFPAGSVEMLSLRAFGDVSIEDIILKTATLTISAGGPLADVFDKIIDGRRKMLPPVSNITYEDGLGLSGKVDGRIVRVGNRSFMDAYGIYGLSDDSIEAKAKSNGFFVVYTAVDDEVCGMFAVKYKSIDPDIEDAVYDIVSNNITLALKTNDPNITPELIEKVFEIPSDYVVVMESHTAEHFDNITKPSKNGNSLLAYSNNASVFASLLVACRKLKTKVSVAVLLQVILTMVGFGACIFYEVINHSLNNINSLNIIAFQFAVALITIFIPSLIKKIK